MIAIADVATRTALASAAILCLTQAALAGAPVPAPLAGAAGPAGLLVFGVAYGGYLLVKKLRSRN
jgi:hypothetical protein